MGNLSEEMTHKQKLDCSERASQALCVGENNTATSVKGF